ncbi:DUF5937 family protein [Streptomyces sp. NPDC090106]|uniref:ArsR/SmtB family transcription factor n=1 Tax=Streptomyces sp. NPDC090106 TaxID=3365946 RepID=UPI00382EAEA7
MLRIHFTAGDLALTHVAAGPDPCWETILGLQQLLCARPGRALQDWRLRARETVARKNLENQILYLRELVPQKGYVPDFLTPAEATDGMQAAMSAIRGTPAGRIRKELQALASRRQRRVPVLLRQLSDADRGSRQLTDLLQALRCVHAEIIAPDWTRLEEHVEADRALRARALRDGGTSCLLESLGPAVRWDPPVLRVDYPVERDLHLSGRGLHLIPSRFCSRVPVALADPRLRPVLVYPVNPTVNEPGPRRAGGLDGLLGRTRAEVLRALHGGATTGELALRLRISASAASQHVHLLSRAGLVHSQRTGASILHTLTPLGAALLLGRVPVVPSDQRISGTP